MYAHRTHTHSTVSTVCTVFVNWASKGWKIDDSKINLIELIPPFNQATERESGLDWIHLLSIDNKLS